MLLLCFLAATRSLFWAVLVVLGRRSPHSVEHAPHWNATMNADEAKNAPEIVCRSQNMNACSIFVRIHTKLLFRSRLTIDEREYIRHKIFVVGYSGGWWWTNGRSIGIDAIYYFPLSKNTENETAHRVPSLRILNKNRRIHLVSTTFNALVLRWFPHQAA